MKIILPYKRLENVSIDDEKIMGGIEKFAQMIYRNFDDVIPVEFTEDDQRKRRVTDMVVHSLRANNADIVLSNYDNLPFTLRIQERADVPVAWFCHVLGNSIAKVNIVKTIPEFFERGGSLFMVSNYQFQTWKALANRICGTSDFLNVSGFIPSSCCSGNEPFIPTNKETDFIVVARCDRNKDPFSLNRKLQAMKSDYGQELESTIITSIYRSSKNQEYYDENQHWTSSSRFQVLWNLPHTEVMQKISRARVLVSTLPNESFGITALEALSCGVPVILFCNSKLEHASAEIPADDSHVIKLRNSCKPEELEYAFIQLGNYDTEKRQEIYRMTQEKHSFTNWKNTLTNHLHTAINNNNNQNKTDQTPNLNSFFES